MNDDADTFRPPLLHWLDITDGSPTLGPLWSFLRRHVTELAAGRYRVEFGHAGVAAGGIRHQSARTVQDAVSVAAAARAARNADALVLGCWGAPVGPVRSMVPCPVASLAEASVLMTRALARSAVVVTVAPSLVAPFTAEILEIAGGKGMASPPVVSYAPESSHLDVLRALDDPAILIDRFDEAGQKAVDAGADAIVTGCGYIGPVFASHGYTHLRGREDVPVLDCTKLAMEHVHALHTLSTAGVHKGAGLAPPAPRIREVMDGVMRAMLGEAPR